MIVFSSLKDLLLVMRDLDVFVVLVKVYLGTLSFEVCGEKITLMEIILFERSITKLYLVIHHNLIAEICSLLEEN